MRNKFCGVTYNKHCIELSQEEYECNLRAIISAPHALRNLSAKVLEYRSRKTLQRKKSLWQYVELKTLNRPCRPL